MIVFGPFFFAGRETVISNVAKRAATVAHPFSAAMLSADFEHASIESNQQLETEWKGRSNCEQMIDKWAMSWWMFMSLSRFVLVQLSLVRIGKSGAPSMTKTAGLNSIKCCSSARMRIPPFMNQGFSTPYRVSCRGWKLF